jgi:hypothetical protein
MENNIKHGGPIFSSHNNGLHVLNQRLQYGEQYQKWRSNLFQSEQWASRAQPETAIRRTISNMAVQPFPVIIMGSTCSTPRLQYGEQYQKWQSNLYQSEHVLNQRLHYREQYQTWWSTLFRSEQWDPRAQPETAIWGTISEMAVQSFPVRTMGSTCSTRDCITGKIKHGSPRFPVRTNYGLHVLNQGLQYGEQYQK